LVLKLALSTCFNPAIGLPQSIGKMISWALMLDWFGR
jgi:hypothetical protein